jgi:hypothetical protein
MPHHAPIARRSRWGFAGEEENKTPSHQVHHGDWRESEYDESEYDKTRWLENQQVLQDINGRGNQ